MAISLIALLILAGTLIYAQTAKKTTTATTTKVSTASLAQRVVARQAFLTEQEQRRLQIENTLEFSPRMSPRPFPIPQLCLLPPATPAAAIDPHRSLFVHDRATLDAGPDFSLRRTLSQIAGQVVPAVPGTNALSIFRQLWDTQNAAPGVVASSPHCTDNGSTINGYPIQCPRAEGQEALGPPPLVNQRIDQYRVLALVNRLDLAHSGWRNCGEHRIIYGKRGVGPAKNLIIFEAVLPNPKPGCREGCLPVAQFWRSLSAINNGLTRAQMLENFYYNGLPGFRPVVHVDHYSATGVSGGYGSSGSGQIRTNQFLQGPWTLKEFKTVIDCGGGPCVFNLVPIMVKVNPFGTLWNEDDPHVNGPDFRADTVAQLARLSSGELMKIGYDVDLKHDDGESISQFAPGFNENYRDQMNAAAAVGFRALLGSGALSANQIANRALTQSCHGCHQPSTFGLNIPGSIGTVNTPVGSPAGPTTDRWPNAANFVHVDTNIPNVRPELAANPAAFGPGLGQIISPALLDFFLPDRKNFLLGQLNAPRCTCIPRFIFLAPELRVRAFEIEKRIQEQFAGKLEDLERRSAEIDVEPPEDDAKLREQLLEERERILVERDRALVAELGRAGIKLPEDEMLDLKARTVKLTESAAARTKAVNELVKKEPPRRTVTGSFRSH
jgi:hypothetical protein